MGLAEVLTDSIDPARHPWKCEAAVERSMPFTERIGAPVRAGPGRGFLHAQRTAEIGRHRRTEQDLGRSLGILEPLFRENPHSLQALQNLANCHQGLGDLAASRSDWKRAELEYRKSLDLWERWKQVGTSSVYDRQRRDAAALLVASAEKKAFGNPPSR
jgi:hypothetical protein